MYKVFNKKNQFEYLTSKIETKELEIDYNSTLSFREETIKLKAESLKYFNFEILKHIYF